MLCLWNILSNLQEKLAWRRNKNFFFIAVLKGELSFNMTTFCGLLLWRYGEEKLMSVICSYFTGIWLQRNFGREERKTHQICKSFISCDWNDAEHLNKNCPDIFKLKAYLLMNMNFSRIYIMRIENEWKKRWCDTNWLNLSMGTLSIVVAYQTKFLFLNLFSILVHVRLSCSLSLF